MFKRKAVIRLTEWTRLSAALAAFVALLLFAVGCGGGSSSGETGESSSSTTAASGGSASGSGEVIDASFGGETATLTEKYLTEPFTAETGISFKMLTVPGEQAAGIIAQNEAGTVEWDMTDKLDDASMAELEEMGYLAKMPAALEAKVKKLIPGSTSYAIPTQEAASVISCNAKVAEKCPQDAADFFNTEEYPGPRTLSSFQPLVAIALGMEAAGIAPDEMFPEDEATSMKNVEMAEEELEGIRSSIKTFYSSSDQAIQLLTSGEVEVAQLWGFAAARAVKEPTGNLELEVAPEGAVNFISYDVVYKGAPNEANAWQYEEWLIEHPEAVAEFSETEPGQGVMDPEAKKLVTSKEALEWTPSSEDATTDIIWYSKFPKVKEQIEEFWKEYTS